MQPQGKYIRVPGENFKDRGLILEEESQKEG